VLAISTLGGVSLALCSDGNVAGWGNNHYGQLGNNSSTDSNVPVWVSTAGLRSGERFSALALGDADCSLVCHRIHRPPRCDRHHIQSGVQRDVAAGKLDGGAGQRDRSRTYLQCVADWWELVQLAEGDEAVTSSEVL